MDNTNYHHSAQSRSSVIVRKSDDNLEEGRREGERIMEYSHQIQGYRHMLPQGYMSNNRSNQSYYQPTNARRNEDRLTYPSFSTPPSFPVRHLYRPSDQQTHFNTPYYQTARQPVIFSQELPQSSDIPDIPPQSPRDVEESILDFESRLAQPSSHLKKFSNNSFGNNENIDDLTNNSTFKNPELGFDIDEMFSNLDHIANYHRNEVGRTEPESPNIPSLAQSDNLDHNSIIEQSNRKSPEEMDNKSDIFETNREDPLSLDRDKHSNVTINPVHNDEDKLFHSVGEQDTEMCSPETDMCEEKRPVSDCHVCGDKAIAHMHYGGICCYSCKAFFRRAVQSGKDKEYRCKKDNDCEVTVKSRRHCQKCRFEKCGKVGMNGSWVLSDEQCEIRFGKTKSSKRKLDDKYEELSKEVRIPDILQFTKEDALTVEYIVCVYERSKDMISFSEVNTFLWEDVFGMSSKHNYSHSEMDSLVSTVIKKNIFFLEANSYFKKLSFIDRKKLLSKNMTEMCHLRGALRFNVSNKSFQWYAPSKDQQASSGLGTDSNAVIKEEDIKTLYGGSNEAARTIVTTIEKIACLNLPTEVILLMMHVVVFNGDGLSLDRSDYVHETQIYYLSMIYRYMFNKLPVIEIHRNMSKVMALLVDLRESGEKASSQKIGSNKLI